MAVGGAKITGFAKVKANLNREILKIEGRSMKGLILSSIIVHRDMESTPPLVPIDLGNLRASWFVVTGTGEQSGASPNFKGENAGELASNHTSAIAKYQAMAAAAPMPIVIMGFSANYAVFVHEMVEGAINWSRPGSGAKFLEAALKNNEKLILQTIRDNVYIK